MKKRIGTVVREADKGVMVRFERPAACTGCGACARNQKTETIFALGEARTGDIVSVQMPEEKARRPVFFNYLIPGIGFAAGLLLAYLIHPSETAMVLGGIVGLAVGGAVLFGIDKAIAKKNGGQALVLSVNDEKTLELFKRLSTCPKATGWSS